MTDTLVGPLPCIDLLISPSVRDLDCFIGFLCDETPLESSSRKVTSASGELASDACLFS
jgi:hypothetical protein